MSEAEPRVAWVDTARGLGILLVMIGHSQALPGIFDKWIFAFHMPLFFFLSGFTFAPKRAQPFGALLRSRARGLLVPFAFFWLASYAFWLGERRLKAEDMLIGPLEPFNGLLMAAGSTLFLNEALWFLPCLFVTTVLWHALLRAGDRIAWSLVVVLGALGMLALGRFADWVVWNADIACVVAPFFALGELLGRRRPAFASTAWLLALICGGFALTLAAYQLNVRIDLHQRIVGNPAWFVAGSLGGIAMLIGVSSLLPSLRALHLLARESLTLLATHLPVYTVIAGLGVVAFHLPRGFKGKLPWFVLVDVAIASAVGLIAAALLRRYLPAAVGATAKRRETIGTLR